MKKSIAFLVTLALAFTLAACNGQPGSEVDDSSSDEHAHDDGDDHGHAGNDDHGPAVELGATTIGSFQVRAARDEGEIAPGGDAAIDVWVTGDTAEIIAVRFWIGQRDAAGSIKAKAEIEDPEEPNHWHAHVEVPEPLADDAQLWVEIERSGGKDVVGFNLNR